jgi:hypothetical protein
MTGNSRWIREVAVGDGVPLTMGETVGDSAGLAVSLGVEVAVAVPTLVGVGLAVGVPGGDGVGDGDAVAVDVDGTGVGCPAARTLIVTVNGAPAGNPEAS